MYSRKQAEWLEWSGLPEELNRLHGHAWVVFKKIVELDCQVSRRPGTIEIPVANLAVRCGLDAARTVQVVELLRREKYLRCFLPTEYDESALIEIRLPVKTPRTADEVAHDCPDPHLKNPGMFRYADVEPEDGDDEMLVQQVIDLYMDRISSKMNCFILEQIEMTASRFPMHKIRYHVERAANHNIREFGWVMKELIRDDGASPAE